MNATPAGRASNRYREGPIGPLFTYNGPATPNGHNTFGGYSNIIVVPQRFVLQIPATLDPARAAPILCAGVTTYSALRHWKVGRGQKVGVVGLGGLGHMAVMIAKALGARVHVFTTSPKKRGAAAALGADGFIVSTDSDAMAAQALTFDFILSTIPVKHDVNPYMACLRRDGVLTLVGALEQLEPGIDNGNIAMHRQSFAGSLIGGLPETQEVLEFCATEGIQPEIELIRLDQVNEAFERMKAGEVRFRHVIDMGTLDGETRVGTRRSARDRKRLRLGARRSARLGETQLGAAASRVPDPDSVSTADQQPRGSLDFRLTGQEEFFERRRIRHRRVERTEDADGGVERFERLFLNDGCDALADTAGTGVLMDDQHAVAVSGDGEDRVAIERRERAKVQHARLDAIERQRVGDSQGRVDVRTVRNDREMTAGTAQRRFADRHRTPDRWPAIA